LLTDRLRRERHHILTGGISRRVLEHQVNRVTEYRDLLTLQSTESRCRGGRGLHRGELRRQPFGNAHGRGQIGEFEAGRSADELTAARGVGSATAIDDIERVLERGDESAFGRRERHHEIP